MISRSYEIKIHIFFFNQNLLPYSQFHTYALQFQRHVLLNTAHNKNMLKITF